MRTLPLTDFIGVMDKIMDIIGKIARFVASLGQIMVTLAMTLTVILTIYMVFRLFNYILRSAALARIGRRRRIKGWWLAWFPIIYIYNVGAIADDYDEKGHGCNTGLKIFLPVMKAAAILFSSLSFWISGARFIPTAKAVRGGIESLRIYLLHLNEKVVPLCLILTALAIFALIIGAIYRFIAIYKIVESCYPKRVIWVMLIYMFIPAAKPFVLLFVSGGDAFPMSEEQGQLASGTETETPDVAEEVPAEETAPATAEEVPAEETAPATAEEAPAEETAPADAEEAPVETTAQQPAEKEAPAPSGTETNKEPDKETVL